MREQSRFNFKSIFRMKASDRSSGRLLGYVGDISLRGLRLLSDEIFDVGTVLELRLRMRNGDGSVTLLDVDGTCLWSREAVRSEYIESGFYIDQPSEEFTRLVETIGGRCA